MDNIRLSQVSFGGCNGEKTSGKCLFDGLDCLYERVKYDYTYPGSDPGDAMGYSLFSVSNLLNGEILGHYLKPFSR